jgi:hypothetical protein
MDVRVQPADVRGHLVHRPQTADRVRIIDGILAFAAVESRGTSNMAGELDTVLPPRPDPQTGRPFPPHAPAYTGRKKSTVPRGDAPPPPPGQSPVLAWHRASPMKNISLRLLAIVAVMVFYDFIRAPCLCAALANLWICLIVPVFGTPLLVIGWRLRRNFTAGADWAMLRDKWVRTYELTSIEARTEKVKRKTYTTLYLVDSEDRELQFGIRRFLGGRPFWDLLYNGILHSVANGAETNQLARDTLKLP